MTVTRAYRQSKLSGGAYGVGPLNGEITRLKAENGGGVFGRGVAPFPPAISPPRVVRSPALAANKFWA